MGTIGNVVLAVGAFALGAMWAKHKVEWVGSYRISDVPLLEEAYHDLMNAIDVVRLQLPESINRSADWLRSKWRK